MKGICNIPLIPCRAEAKESAEMETQLLFGETYTVIDEIPKWIKIKCEIDGYICWIDSKLYFPINELIKSFKRTITKTSIIFDKNGEETLLPMGSVLINYNKASFNIEDKNYQLFLGETSEYLEKINGKKIVLLAKRLLNTPYLWGGKSSFGIDCSGLTQLIFSLFNYHLPRNASQQEALGDDVFISESKAGDLAFFVSENNKITHVGIMMNNHQIIHASGTVRIDTIDEKGILKDKEYTHQLYKIKRLI